MLESFSVLIQPAYNAVPMTFLPGFRGTDSPNVNTYRLPAGAYMLSALVNSTRFQIIPQVKWGSVTQTLTTVTTTAGRFQYFASEQPIDLSFSIAGTSMPNTNDRDSTRAAFMVVPMMAQSVGGGSSLRHFVETIRHHLKGGAK